MNKPCLGIALTKTTLGQNQRSERKPKTCLVRNRKVTMVICELHWR
jgi:hypothetical protein